MPKQPPETSTSRSALSVAGAALDLCHEADPKASLDRLAVVMRAGKDLRSYQIEEVLGFLAGRLGTDLPDPAEGKHDGAEDGPVSEHISQGQRPRTGPAPVRDAPQA